MVKYINHRIQFSDLKRIVVDMRAHGMSEAEVIQDVIYCLNELGILGDE